MPVCVPHLHMGQTTERAACCLLLLSCLWLSVLQAAGRTPFSLLWVRFSGVHYSQETL